MKVPLCIAVLERIGFSKNFKTLSRKLASVYISVQHATDNFTRIKRTHGFNSLLAMALFVAIGFAPILSLPVTAATSNKIAGFGPTEYKSDTSYGHGVFIAPHRIELFESVTATAPYEILEWDRNSDIGSVKAVKQEAFLSTKNIFIVFYPQSDLAILPVVGEGENGWLEVIVDQRQRKTAWVKSLPATATTPEASSKQASVTANAENPATDLKDLGHYQTWQEFMRLYAKTHGIFWLAGVPEYHRHIRQAPVDSAKMVNILIVRSLKVRHVRGNWMLVEAVDFNHSMPMGWLRWRDEEGRLLIFANFTGQKSTLYMTGN